MTSIDIPRLPTDPGAAPSGGGQGVARRVIDRVTYPAERPFSSLTAYYVLVVAVVSVILYFVPSGRAMVSGERLAQLMKGNLFDPAGSGSLLSWSTTLDMALAMLGAFLLMLPTSWVYMAERRRKGFSQSMVQTMIVLAVAIAGVVVIVRNSTALAFSLTGIVAAVRFRNDLADTRDTLYIFTCIGVGLASGVQAMAAALVLSMIFNYITLLFWRGDYGMCELGRSPGHLLVGSAACHTNGKGNGKGAKKGQKEKDFTSVLVVRALDAERARPAIDGMLATECRRFELAEIDKNSKGQGVLKYRIRLGKNSDPRNLEDALLTRAAPNVVGARIH